MPMKFFLKTLAFSLLGILILTFTAYGAALWFKKDILSYFNQQLNKEIKGIVTVSDLDFTLLETFPQISISLNDVIIKDSLHKKNVLTMKRLFLQVNVFKLISKKIEVKSVLFRDCDIMLSKDSSGYSNVSVFERRKPANDSLSTANKESQLVIDLKKITFENVTLNYKDQLLKKNIHLQFLKVGAHLVKDTQQISCHLQGKVYSKGLIFKESKGPFLKNQEFGINIRLDYKIHEQTCVLQPSVVQNGSERYDVEGGIDLKQQPQLLLLNIKSIHTDYDRALALLSTHLQQQLSKFHVKGGLSCEVRLKIPIHKREDPRADLAFQLQNSTLSIMGIDLEQTNLIGSFNNQSDTLKPTDDENSIVNISKADFNYHGILCAIDGSLHNLTIPHIEACFNAQAPLKALHYFIDSTQYRLPKGDITFSGDYTGPLLEVSTSGVKMPGARLHGLLSIHDGQFIMEGKNLDFSNTDAQIQFDESDVNLKQLSFLLNDNPMNLTGQVKNLLPFLLYPDRDMNVGLQLYSSKFHVDKLFVPDKVSAEPGQYIKKDSSKWLMTRVGNIMNHIEVNFSLVMDKVYWKRTNGAKVTAMLSLNKKSVRIHKFFAKFEAGGSVSLKSRYLLRPNNNAHFSMQAQLKGIEASNLFYTFDNFSQATVTHENLEGRIDAKVLFSCDLQQLYIPQQKSMNAEVGLVLRNGRLKNFAPFKNLNRLVFKHRDLMDIQFEEINNQFMLKGYELYVQKMQVNSSALSLSVEGVYSFKDKTDLSIKIPLSNLKSKHDSTYYHIEEGNGISLLLRAKEKNGKMAVFLDPFDKYHKESKVQ